VSVLRVESSREVLIHAGAKVPVDSRQGGYTPVGCAEWLINVCYEPGNETDSLIPSDHELHLFLIHLKFTLYPRPAFFFMQSANTLSGNFKL
jgi:hypothetical protein